MAKRKKYRSVYDNLFSLEELPKTKKLHKKKKTKSINKTIDKKDLNKSRPKKRITNTGNIINLNLYLNKMKLITKIQWKKFTQNMMKN